MVVRFSNYNYIRGWEEIKLIVKDTFLLAGIKLENILFIVPHLSCSLVQFGEESLFLFKPFERVKREEGEFQRLSPKILHFYDYFSPRKTKGMLRFTLFAYDKVDQNINQCLLGVFIDV